MLTRTRQRDLSAPELAVLRAAAEGLTVPATAVRIDRSVETVKSHRKSVIRSLGARNTVHAVEPNAAMRAAAQEYLASFVDFTAVDGTSDQTTLADSSVDLIVAAQAFHWFDAEKARQEFKRILKPGGHIVLIWNERQLTATPFLGEYENFLLRHAYDYGSVRHENIAAKEISDFFQKEYGSARFANKQVFDFEGLKGRMLSASYMPDETDPQFDVVIKELQSLFAKHAESGKIEILYDTNVYHSHV